MHVYFNELIRICDNDETFRWWLHVAQVSIFNHISQMNDANVYA